MPDRPNASELIEAVFEFLAGEVLPAADDQRLRFRTLVAMNALGIARRELESNTVLLDQGQLADRPLDQGRRVRRRLGLRGGAAARRRISNPAYSKHGGAPPH
jgi:hypothetical protein